MDRVGMIEARLREALAPARLEVVDDSQRHAGHAGARDGGGHFSVIVVSNRFAGQGPVERHRMIYTALGEEMKKEIHALSIKAYTPDEFQQTQPNP